MAFQHRGTTPTKRHSPAARDFNTVAGSLHTLFRRCVECPGTQPTCPKCGDDETCSLLPQSCNACASTSCVKIGSLPGQLAPKSSTPIGPIVGGVIAGVVVIILAVFCIWFFCIRPKRRTDTWSPPEKRDQATLSRNPSRAHSIASTVLTRASNVIQIGYIPGVTGRSPPESPSVPPPMPAMPSHMANSTASNSPQLEQHFFMPSDLRDSTWSDTSSADPRISLAPSLARASVATTIYRNDAVVPPIPAQQAYRAQANVVRVHQGSVSNQGGVVVPPLPQAQKGLNINGSSIIARHVTARPIEVKKAGSSQRVPTLANLAAAHAKSEKKPETPSRAEVTTPVFSDEKEVVSPVVSSPVELDSTPATPHLHTKPSAFSLSAVSASGLSAVTPLDSPSTGGSSRRQNDDGGLTAMIEEAISRAARDGPRAQRPELQKHDSGPFSDSNEVRDNQI